MYVSNLGYHVREEDLKQLFTAFGDVSSVKVIVDRETGRSRGFGFIEMTSREASDKAMTALNDKEIEGRNIRISPAKQKEKRSFSHLW